MTTIGEALIQELERRAVDCVFGIPGVHTIEMYRGLASSGIRHVTPRHEQGAAFMADGYARASGKPGVAFVITGPGFTNTLTAMAQARADSVPMLVVSGVNALDTLGRGLGHLHELPDQLGLSRSVALAAERISCAADLIPALERVFAAITSARPGPVHIELPLDVAGLPFEATAREPAPVQRRSVDTGAVARAAELLNSAKQPVVLAGGGSIAAADKIRALAERLDAPVVQTVNARGAMFGHPLGVPASPSLRSIRDLIAAADVVLALGTELGPTDYDMYDDGNAARMQNLIRVDICGDQLARHPAELPIQADATAFLGGVMDAVTPRSGDGAARAETARTAARAEIGMDMGAAVDMLDALRTALPNALSIGDSTQPIYAGNLYYDHDRPGGWFNSATGYGALGYGIPAAIGAAIAQPDVPVTCLVGDGGAQFSLPEVMTAVDESLPVVFIIWNSRGYLEIDRSMQAANVTVVGCDPTPPDFELTAKSFGVPYVSCALEPGDLTAALHRCREQNGPSVIEVRAYESYNSEQESTVNA
ncbi:5-guanidino-2-oxopentanoate decarboxylase [Amaricoccus tamworthensis]|uniref:5-guanidino-2-oxopentanoate decarboxylase n=1 Tax=Amaricoccus tamworthensis TaxID=57002 RepID=UPI003C7CC7E8